MDFRDYTAAKGDAHMATNRRSELEIAAINFVQAKETRDKLKKARSDSLKKCSVGKIWSNELEGIRKATVELDWNDTIIDGVYFDLHETCIYRNVPLCESCVKSQQLHADCLAHSRAVPVARKALESAVKAATTRSRKPALSGRNVRGTKG